MIHIIMGPCSGKILTSDMALIGHFPSFPPGLCIKTRLGAQPFLWKWVLFAWEWKIISISKVEHLTSFWYRGPGELGNGLLKQRHRTAEMATNNTKMGWNHDSNTEKCNYCNTKLNADSDMASSSIIMQKRQALKFRPGIYSSIMQYLYLY